MELVENHRVYDLELIFDFRFVLIDPKLYRNHMFFHKFYCSHRQKDACRTEEIFRLFVRSQSKNLLAKIRLGKLINILKTKITRPPEVRGWIIALKAYLYPLIGYSIGQSVIWF
jgi:hypothetical protein